MCAGLKMDSNWFELGRLRASEMSQGFCELLIPFWRFQTCHCCPLQGYCSMAGRRAPMCFPLPGEVNIIKNRCWWSRANSFSSVEKRVCIHFLAQIPSSGLVDDKSAESAEFFFFFLSPIPPVDERERWQKRKRRKFYFERRGNKVKSCWAKLDLPS